MTQHIVEELAASPPGTIIFEQGLAAMFHRHPSALRRAVARGELPPPVRMLGRRAWTTDAIVTHMRERQEEAARQQAAMQAKIATHMP